MDLREAIRGYFATRSDVVAVYLFGSEARGTARAGSDVDVAVLYRDTPAPSLTSAPFDDGVSLELALDKPVDLVTLNRCSAELARGVLMEGDLLLENNRGERIIFEVAARNRYFDLKPVLDRYRRRPA